jgi:hypothetical protein
MRTNMLVLLTVVAIVGGLILVSCGESDPALAPAGSIITILTNQEVNWNYSCQNPSGLPIVCYETWVQYLVAYCQLRQEDSVTRDDNVQECIDGGISLEECSNYWCADGNLWIDLTLDTEVLFQARGDIGSNIGSCGYLNTIVAAFVTLSTSSGSTGDSGGDTVGGSLSGTPLNDIEVRFIAQGGELYELADVPSQIPPLANPYVTATDDRGKAEVKYRTPLPTVCGSTITYVLSADIGVSQAAMSVNFTVDAGTLE